MAGEKDPRYRGWRWDAANSRLVVNVGGDDIGYFAAAGLSILGTAMTVNVLNDNIPLAFGTESDVVAVLRSTILNANTALTGVVVGTPVTPAVAANSLILANITADGDILIATQTGGNTHAAMWVDASAAITRFYSGAGVEVLKLDAAAVTVTGTLTATGLTTSAGFRSSGAAHFGLGAGEAVAIVSGVATVTKPIVNLTGEGATTDTLDSITYTGAAEGDLLFLCCGALGYTITADNSATMLLGAGTRALVANSTLVLRFIGTTWIEVAFLTAAS